MGCNRSLALLLLLLFGAARQADAQTFGTAVAAGVANGSSITQAYTVTTGSLLLVAAMGSDTAIQDRTITHVTYGGVALTKAVDRDDGTFEYVSLWYLDNPTAGAANVVADSLPSGSVTDYGLVIVEVFGVDLTTRFGSSAVNSGTGTSATTAGLTPTSDQVIIAAIASDSQASLTESGTLLAEIQNVDSDSSYGMQSYSSTGGAITPTYTQNSTGWSMLAVILNGTSGAAPPVRRLPLLGVGGANY